MSGTIAAIRSEWIKFRTVRSTLMGVALTFVFTIGLGALVTSLVRSRWNAPGSHFHHLTFDPVSTSLAGVFFAQFAVGVIGVLSISSEYGSGAIRTTLAAISNRYRLVAAKIVVLVSSMLVVTEIAVFIAFLIGQQIYKGVVPTASLASASTLRQVVMTGLYLTLASLLGMAIALVLRQSAASISTFVVVLLILPIIVSLLPSNYQNDISRYEPLSLGQAMRANVVAAYSFTPWVATLVFLGEVAAVFVIGTILFEKRDA